MQQIFQACSFDVFYILALHFRNSCVLYSMHSFQTFQPGLQFFIFPIYTTLKVIRVGMGTPGLKSFVLSLNSLQNWEILTPFY